jgi:hypothetical protein
MTYCKLLVTMRLSRVGWVALFATQRSKPLGKQNSTNFMALELLVLIDAVFAIKIYSL